MIRASVRRQGIHFALWGIGQRTPVNGLWGILSASNQGGPVSDIGQEISFIVRTAVPQEVGHCPDGLQERDLTINRDDAGDTAHGLKIVSSLFYGGGFE
jgi:hypothetical protein